MFISLAVIQISFLSNHLFRKLFPGYEQMISVGLLFIQKYHLTALIPSIDGHRTIPNHKGVGEKVDVTAHCYEQVNSMVHSSITRHQYITFVRLHGYIYSEFIKRENMTLPKLGTNHAFGPQPPE